MRGFQDAVAAGAPKITVTVSASEAHSRANIRMTCDEVVESLAGMVRFRDGLEMKARPHIEVGVSTAFGCTLQGEVFEDFAIASGQVNVPEGATRRCD